MSVCDLQLNQDNELVVRHFAREGPSRFVVGRVLPVYNGDDATKNTILHRKWRKTSFNLQSAWAKLILILQHISVSLFFHLRLQTRTVITLIAGTVK